MTRTIALIAALSCTLLLAGCVTTGQSGDVVTIKPSRQQIESAAKTVVCDSFDNMTFAWPGDTKDTVKQIREFNAARASFGCK